MTQCKSVTFTFRSFTIVLMAMLLMTMAFTALQAHAEGHEHGQNLLLNSGFEELEDGVPVLWEASDSFPSSHISPTSEEARTGDTSLKMESQLLGGDDYWVRQLVEIEEGHVYEFTAWMKSELRGRGAAQMKVEFYQDTPDANGWIDGIHGEGYDYPDQWGKMTMAVEAPPEANLALVYLRLRNPGIAYFDDVSFHLGGLPPSLDVYADRIFYYEEVEQGKVSGTIRPPDYTYDGKTVEVHIYSEDGETIVNEDGIPATEHFQFTFDPSQMVLRVPYTLHVTLKSADDETLLENKETIYRWERPQTLREDGTLMVDGEPFFPIIGYHLSVEDYPNVGETINTIQGLQKWDDRFDFNKVQHSLDEAHRNGLKVMLPIYPDLYKLDGPQGYEYVEAKVEAFKDHPAIVGWMISDEPDNQAIEGHDAIYEDIVELYRMIRTVDPVHPTYMVVARAEYFHTLGRATDILVTDPYPLDHQPITKVSEYMDVAKRLHPDKPVWHILQAFQIPPNWPYLPNITEIRNMAYQSILGDAQGLGYYSFNDPSWNLMESELYPDLIDFTDDEIPYIEDLVLHGKEIDRVQHDDVQWGLWEKNQKLYAIAVNVTESPQAVTIPLPEDGYQVEVIAPEKSKYNLFAEQLTLELAPLESTLITLSPPTLSADIITRVEELEAEGAFASNHVAHALKLHLTAIEHFETAGKTEKVVQHIAGLNSLLHHHYESEQIIEDAYQTLLTDADLMRQWMVESMLQTQIVIEDPDIVAGEKVRVAIQLHNRTVEALQDVEVSVQWPDAFGLQPETSLIPTLAEGEMTEVYVDVPAPDQLSVGDYTIKANVLYQHHGVEMNNGKEHPLHILPLIEAALHTAEIEASDAGDYPVSFTLTNHAATPTTIELDQEATEDILLEGGGDISLQPHETLQVNAILRLSDTLPEGAYEVVLLARVDGNLMERLPLRVTLDKNVVVNAGFEQLLNNVPEFWRSSDNWESGAVVTAAEAARSGNSGVLMTLNNTRNHWIRQAVPVEENTTYELTAWLRSFLSSGGKARLKIEFYSDTPRADNILSGIHGDDEFGANEEWEHISMQATSPDGAKYALLYLRLYGPGSIHYDDIAFKKVNE